MSILNFGRKSNKWREIIEAELDSLEGENPRPYVEMRDIMHQLEEAGCKDRTMDVVRLTAERIAEGKLSARYYVAASNEARTRITPFFNSIAETPRFVPDYENNTEKAVLISDLDVAYCLLDTDLNGLS